MRANYKVADVLNLEAAHLPDYCLNTWQLSALHAIRKCRTAALGGHIDQCNCCNKIHISYNSCRNRHCPSCGGEHQSKWVAKRMEELLPVGYFHVVFTLPIALNQLSLHEPRIVYKTLFDAAWQTLQSFGTNNLGAKMGMIAILHTWGQNLSLHPHLHCIVPDGGVQPNGAWKPASAKGNFLFPVRGMSKVFRAKYVALLRKQLPNHQALYKQLFNKSWVVYAKPPFSGAHNVVEYLGRYTNKIAISNHRIVKIDEENKQVYFRMKDYRKGGHVKTTQLTTKEFIRRFSLHILPKGFTRIRHYGILSSTWKRKKLWDLQAKLQAELPLIATPPTTEKEVIKHRICHQCKTGKLVTIFTFDKRGPPKFELLPKMIQNQLRAQNITTIA